MGLSIFYSLSLPAGVPQEDAQNALSLLRAAAQRLLKGGFPKGSVSRLFALNRDEIFVAQGNPNCEPFAFARQAHRPLGARDCPPEVGIGFNVTLAPDWQMSLGLCRYPTTTPIMVEWKNEGLTKYDGRWFYYDYIDPLGREDRAFVRTLLKAASGHGFGVEVRDEAGERFDELRT